MRHAAFLLFVMLPVAGYPLVDDPTAGPPELVSDDLDRVIQDRFGNLTEDDIHQGRLGMRRIVVPRKRQFVPANDRERAVLAKLGESGWSVSFYVLGEHRRLYGAIKTDPKAVVPAVDRKELLRLGKGAMDARAALLERQGEVRLEARPIPVSGPSCAGCHDPSMKQGDPLGAVIYVLTRETAP